MRHVYKIAQIDHSFHRQTRSTGFLAETLQAFGHAVDRFYDDSWQGGAGVDFAMVRDYDAIVIVQVAPQWRGRLCKLHPNITFIPMLDSYGYSMGRRWGHLAWRQFSGVKILNFSQLLHYVCRAFALESRHFRYYREPFPEISVPQTGLHGFFWARREDQISVQSIFRLLGDTRFDSLHLHLAPDPGSPPPVLPPQDVLERHHVSTSRWFDDKNDLETVLNRANVFFAPRLEEGIGQAMLKAFARGQCVVAPNCGVMNEYVMDKVNGLLYDPGAPLALDFSNALALGRRGYELACQGRAAWEQRAGELVEFILTPNRTVYGDRARDRLMDVLLDFPWAWPTIRRVHSALARLKSR